MLRSWTATATPAQIAAYLMGLRLKGETVEEIAGLRASDAGSSQSASPSAIPWSSIPVAQAATARHTFNISTTTAFVVAGAGLTVAKHGNRSVSSKSGSADVLSALGRQYRVFARPRRRMHQ